MFQQRQVAGERLMTIKEDIDQPRAEKAKKHAEEMLAKGGLTDKEYKIAEAKLKRALVRLGVKE